MFFLWPTPLPSTFLLPYHPYSLRETRLDGFFNFLVFLISATYRRRTYRIARLHTPDRTLRQIGLLKPQVTNAW